MLTGHPAGAQAYPPQPFVFTTTTATDNNGQSQPFFQTHPQPNFAFPFILTPQTPTSPNPEAPIVSYLTPTSTTDGTTFSA